MVFSGLRFNALRDGQLRSTSGTVSDIYTAGQRMRAGMAVKRYCRSDIN